MTGIRELRGDLAAHVRRAAAGHPTVITIGGEPAAVLAPIAGHPSPSISPAVERAALIASGAVIAPRRADGRPAEGTVPVWGNVRLDRLLREIRG